MTTKFTPGPWVHEASGKRGAWVKGSTGEWTALSCGDTDESATSNAHLIAAAPEIYEALEQIRKLNASASMSGYTDKHALEELYTANRKASAALAKARGEQS